MCPGPASIIMEGRYYCTRERKFPRAGLADAVLQVAAPVPEDRHGDSNNIRPQFELRHGMCIPTCALDRREPRAKIKSLTEDSCVILYGPVYSTPRRNSTR